MTDRATDRGVYGAIGTARARARITGTGPDEQSDASRTAPLRLLLLAEYIRRLPSSATRWVPDLARALAARGHHVTVALGGADDHEELLPIRTLIHNPRRTHNGDDPRAFVRWARDTHQRLSPDACVSFTRLYAGEVCIPLGASSAAYLGTLFRSKAPHSALFELAHRLWLFPNMFMERRACHAACHDSAYLSGVVPNAHGFRLATLGPVRPGFVDLGYASRFAAPDPATFDTLRARARDLLGISPARCVLLASGAHFRRAGLRTVLEGLARVRTHAHGLAPILVLVGRRAHSLHQMALRAGVADGVRVLGETSRMDALLAACDAAIAPSPRPASPDECCSGRFTADVLRLGRPILAHWRAPGTELLAPSGGVRPTVGADHAPGLIVRDQTPGAWAGAIEKAMDAAWLAGATRAAENLSPSVAIDRVVQRLEEAICGADATLSVHPPTTNGYRRAHCGDRR